MDGVEALENKIRRMTAARLNSHHAEVYYRQEWIERVAANHIIFLFELGAK